MMCAAAHIPLPLDSRPAAQLFVFATVTTPLLLTDPSFTAGFVAALFVVQSLLYGGLLYVVARGGARRLARRAPPRRRALLLVAIAALLGVLAMANVYRAPLSHGGGATTIVGVFR